MLKGCLKCSEINKLLLSYIHFELNKKMMTRVAIHLRNCPNCMEKYTKIQKRKKDLKLKMREIEKQLRMEREISQYLDNEATDDLIFNVEGMVLCDENYKKALIEGEEIKRILKNSYNKISELKNPKIAKKIIAKIRVKKFKLLKFKNYFIRLFEHSRHAIAKFG